MTLEEIDRALAPHGLAAVGAFHPGPQDGAPDGVATLVLVGAGPQGLWDAFSRCPEAADGAADPLDRWSARVLGTVAQETGAEALFPFGGPPWLPFGRWAAAAEGNRPSPVVIPVSPNRGLWASYRGALGLRARLPLPDRPTIDPCAGCPAPCLTACPVSAFAEGRYDVPACIAHVTGPEGTPCRGGCLVRLACPVGTPPPEAQRRFHMAAFVAAQAQRRN
ncbi:MAG: ferredoxin [Paracoccaceae bacterium]